MGTLKLWSGLSASILPDEGSYNRPLHLAVLHGHKEVAARLVEAGASLTLENDKNMMPLGLCKDPEMFQTLLSLLSNDDQRFENEMNKSIANGYPCKTIMHYAALHCMDVSLIEKLLLKALPNPLSYNQSSIQGSNQARNQSSNQERNKSCKIFLEQVDEEGNPFLHKAGNPMLNVVFKGLIESEHKRKFTELLIANCGFYEAPILNRPLLDGLITLQSIMGKLELELRNYKSKEERDELLEQGWTTSLPTYLALYLGKHEVFHFLMDSNLGLTLNQWDTQKKRTCLHWAVVHNRVDIVERLFICSFSCSKGKKKHREEMVNCERRYKVPSPSLKDGAGMTAFQIAFEQENEEMMETLRGRREFKEYEDKLLKDREVYVQAVHAILVAAALTAGVTFAGWLQVPSRELENAWMKTFWGANSMAFFLAVAAMGLCVRILLPTPTIYMGQIVSKLRTVITYTASTLLCSLATVMVAFIAGGFAALTDAPNHRTVKKIMIATTVVGGVGCVATFLYYVYPVILPYFPGLPRHNHLRRQHPKIPSYRQVRLLDPLILEKNLLSCRPPPAQANPPPILVAV